MPVSTMLVIAAIVGMFSIFAVALAWADRQTRGSATLAAAKASGRSRRSPA
jgi:multisubunit Na+/H+ antiporter MnhC subunit